MPITYDVESVRPFCGGLWKTQQLLGFLLGCGAFTVLCLVAPIALNEPANRMLGLTALCGAFWVFEVLPIYITALVPLVVMPLASITTSRIAAEAYWNPVQLLILGTFLVDIALEEVHLPRRLALKLLMTTGVMQPWILLLCLMSACFFLACFINNVAVVLMVTPFVLGLLHAAEERAAEADAEVERGATEGDEQQAAMKQVERFSLGLLLGVAYATTAGGMATLVGSIPNEILLGSKALSSQVHYAEWMAYAFPVALLTCLLAYLLVYFRYLHAASRCRW